MPYLGPVGLLGFPSDGPASNSISSSSSSPLPRFLFVGALAVAGVLVP